jgi:hypothetical protein
VTATTEHRLFLCPSKSHIWNKAMTLITDTIGKSKWDGNSNIKHASTKVNHMMTNKLPQNHVELRVRRATAPRVTKEDLNSLIIKLLAEPETTHRAPGTCRTGITSHKGYNFSPDNPFAPLKVASLDGQTRLMSAKPWTTGTALTPFDGLIHHSHSWTGENPLAVTLYEIGGAHCLAVGILNLEEGRGLGQFAQAGANPNVVIDFDSSGNDTVVWLTATSNINAGEEITIDARGTCLNENTDMLSGHAPNPQGEVVAKPSNKATPGLLLQALRRTRGPHNWQHCRRLRALCRSYMHTMSDLYAHCLSHKGPGEWRSDLYAENVLGATRETPSTFLTNRLTWVSLTRDSPVAECLTAIDQSDRPARVAILTHHDTDPPKIKGVRHPRRVLQYRLNWSMHLDELLRPAQSHHHSEH